MEFSNIEYLPKDFNRCVIKKEARKFMIPRLPSFRMYKKYLTPFPGTKQTRSYTHSLRL